MKQLWMMISDRAGWGLLAVAMASLAHPALASQPGEKASACGVPEKQQPATRPAKQGQPSNRGDVVGKGGVASAASCGANANANAPASRTARQMPIGVNKPGVNRARAPQ